MKTKENNTTTASRANDGFFSSKNSAEFFAPKGDLQTSEPGDKLEKEADQMADLASGSLGLEEENMALEGSVEDATVEEKIRKSAGSGQPLEPGTRAEMENKLGADFSEVNIHSNPDAGNLNHTLGSQAFTHRKDIYFNEGKYNPETSGGKHLLAHELTHTIQQSGKVSSVLQFTIGDNRDLAAPRFAGDLVLEACLDGERVLQQGASGEAVTKIQQALIDAGFPLPQFGADGSFGNETKTALKDFQRTSSLVDDGKVGRSTMSALDALYTGGAPALPPAIPITPPPTTAPTVTTSTTTGASRRIAARPPVSGTTTMTATDGDAR